MGLLPARKNPFPVRRCHVSQRSDFHMVQLNYHTPVILNKQAKPLAIPEGKQHYQSNVSVTITQSLRGACLIESLKFYFQEQLPAPSEPFQGESRDSPSIRPDHPH